MDPGDRLASPALPLADWPRSLKLVVADEIRARIIDGRLALGEKLSEASLAATLDIGRTPVREALLQLQLEGMVDVRPQRGTFVFAGTADDIRSVCEMRGILEAGAIRIGAGGEFERLLATLRANVERAGREVERGEMAAFERLDTEFHEAIVALSGNRYLATAYRGIANKVRALRHRLPPTRERIARAVAHHRAIVDLLADRRIAEAAEELVAHVENVQAILIAGGVATDGGRATAAASGAPTSRARHRS